MKKLLCYILILFLACPWQIWAGTPDDPTDPYTTIAALNTAIVSGNCGKTLYLNHGVYTSGEIDLDVDCTEGNELTVSCADGSTEDLGDCKYTSTTQSVAVLITGNYQILKGFWFDNNGADKYMVYIYDNSVGGEAKYNRITQNKFEDWGNDAIIVGRPSGTGENSENSHNEIDHNEFLDSGNASAWAIRVRFDTDPDHNLNKYTNIHHNAFIDHGSHSGGNIETIQVGDGAVSHDFDAYTTIEHNLFQNCCSDNEMVSFKTSSNYFRYNTIIYTGCIDEDPTPYAPEVTLRRSDDSEIIGNIFYSEVYSGYNAGIRIFGDNHKIINNYINCVSPCQSGSITVGSGDSGGSYIKATNVDLINNTTHGCLRYGFRVNNDTYVPDNILWMNNRAESTCGTVGGYMYSNSVGTNLTFTDNLTWCTHGDCDDGSSINGVDQNTTEDFELTQQKTGLPVNWYHPDSGEYDNGTYDANVLVDIQGQTRSNPPDIGSDESGGTDELIDVGPTWTGSYQIQGQMTNPEVTITAPDALAAEYPINNGQYLISCSPDCDSTAVVFTMSGTALGSDYNLFESNLITPVSSPVSITGSSFSVYLVPVNDSYTEDTETAILTINSGSGYTVGSPASATVNIEDDDQEPQNWRGVILSVVLH